MIKLFHYIKNKNDENFYLNLTYLAIFFWAIAYSAFEYLVPIQLENSGYNFTMIGLLISTMSLFSLFTNFWYGHLQKSKTKRMLFFISSLLLMLSILFFTQNNTLILAFISMILYGFGFDLFDITAYTSLYDNSKENNRSTNLSLRDVFENIGIIFGVIISGLLIYAFPNFLLFCVIILFFVPIIITLRYKNHVSVSNTPLLKEFFSDLKLIGLSKGLFALILISLIAFWNGMFFAFEPLFIQNFKNQFINEVVLGGLLLAAYVLPVLLFEYSFGKIEDKIGRKKFVIVGLVLASLSLIWLSNVTTILSLFVSTFFISTGIMAISNPAINGIYEKFAVEHLGKEKDGDSASFFELFANIGYITGPLFGGFIISKIGFFNSFKIMGFVFMFFVLLSIFIIKDNN